MTTGTKKACFCGCSSFDIYQWDEVKGNVVLVCQGCRCERRISTPNCAAENYTLKPDVQDYKWAENEKEE